MLYSEQMQIYVKQPYPGVIHKKYERMLVVASREMVAAEVQYHRSCYKSLHKKEDIIIHYRGIN